MIYKIILASLLSICLTVGIILLMNRHNSTKQLIERNYIIVTAKGNVDYPFPLPFDKGATVKDIASSFATRANIIQRQVGTKYFTLDPSQRIYSDIQIKIS